MSLKLQIRVWSSALLKGTAVCSLVPAPAHGNWRQMTPCIHCDPQHLGSHPQATVCKAQTCREDAIWIFDGIQERADDVGQTESVVEERILLLRIWSLVHRVIGQSLFRSPKVVWQNHSPCGASPRSSIREAISEKTTVYMGPTSQVPLEHILS